MIARFGDPYTHREVSPAVPLALDCLVPPWGCRGIEAGCEATQTARGGPMARWSVREPRAGSRSAEGAVRALLVHPPVFVNGARRRVRSGTQANILLGSRVRFGRPPAGRRQERAAGRDRPAGPQGAPLNL